MDWIEALDRGRAEFGRRLRLVQAADWPRATPCDAWTVRVLAHHVVAGNHMSAILLNGASRDEALAALQGDSLGDDAVGAFEASADELAAAFAAPDVFDRQCDHPAGPITNRELLGYRIADYALHAWDLARAIGADETLDPELVDVVYEGMSPMAAYIDKTGFFGAGPSGTIADGESAQSRLLDLSGRRA